nr:uncharacterized protein LOC125418715 [Ziziphus jujuba var. spinosa]
MICCSQLQNGLTMSRPRKSYSGKFLSANNSSVPYSCSNTCTSSTRDENELREESEAFCWRTRIYPPRKVTMPSRYWLARQGINNKIRIRLGGFFPVVLSNSW